eukprot:SAG31_NODE_2117_length_6412_cov_7.762712_8_plen_194_part_00
MVFILPCIGAGRRAAESRPTGRLPAHHCAPVPLLHHMVVAPPPPSQVIWAPWHVQDGPGPRSEWVAHSTSGSRHSKPCPALSPTATSVRSQHLQLCWSFRWTACNIGGQGCSLRKNGPDGVCRRLAALTMLLVGGFCATTLDGPAIRAILRSCMGRLGPPNQGCFITLMMNINWHSCTQLGLNLVRLRDRDIR